MSIFEYSCNECNYLFALFQIVDDDYPECPLCGSDSLSLLPPPDTIILGGSGYYLTDYSKREPKKAVEIHNANK